MINMKKICFYKALRAAIGDWKRKKSRHEIDKIANRANPIHWLKYISSSTPIKMFNNSNTSMVLELRERAYINERTPGRATFIISAKRMPGKQCLWNRLEVLRQLRFDWIDIPNDNLLRVELKRQFFVF